MFTIPNFKIINCELNLQRVHTMLSIITHSRYFHTQPHGKIRWNKSKHPSNQTIWSFNDQSSFDPKWHTALQPRYITIVLYIICVINFNRSQQLKKYRVRQGKLFTWIHLILCVPLDESTSTKHAENVQKTWGSGIICVELFSDKQILAYPPQATSALEQIGAFWEKAGRWRQKGESWQTLLSSF